MEYSVFDWAVKQYRVFTAPHSEDGLFDPTIKKLSKDARFGISPEAVMLSVPSHARFAGTSTLARGRVSIDGRGRAQASASLPQGLGTVPASVGSVGAFDFDRTEVKTAAAGAVVGAVVGGKKRWWQGGLIGGVVGYFLPRFFR